MMNPLGADERFSATPFKICAEIIARATPVTRFPINHIYLQFSTHTRDPNFLLLVCTLYHTSFYFIIQNRDDELK